MDVLFSIVSGFVVEVGKLVSKCIYPGIKNTFRFSSNIENLRKEMEKLTKFRDAIKEKVEEAENEGYKAKPDVLTWLELVDKLEKEWKSMQENIAAAKMLAYKCFPNCGLRNEVSTQAQTMRDQICKLIEAGENFGSNLVVENYQMKRVEFIPGPSIEGQSALAVTIIGTSMRGEEVELWRDALKSLRVAEPHNKDVQDKVYKVIKWSFDSLVSLDDPKHVNKRRGDIQSCFLYCSLYPMAISTDDLIHCWWAEGFLGEHNTYEEAYDRGFTMIKSLKDACLLEIHTLDSVKMHDVVRDVAIWIANSYGDEHKSDCFMECPKTTTLLLQDNRPLAKIPHEFFFAFPALRVLDLSSTGIAELPSSINRLYQLRALILQNCRSLKELPPN